MQLTQEVMSWHAKGSIAVLETSFHLAVVQISKETGRTETAKYNVSGVVIFMHQPLLTMYKVLFK